MRKHEGSQETDLRVRFQMGSSTFVSKAFKGFVNSNQFTITKIHMRIDFCSGENSKGQNGCFMGLFQNEEKAR